MIITVGAEKGGVAKTRLATHIATIAAREGVDVLLLDTDKQGSADSWNDIRKDTLDEEEAKAAAAGVKNYVKKPRVPLATLPANPLLELRDFAKKYQLVVVDIGAQNYRTMLECAAVSDLVLVPCGADQQEIESTERVFAALGTVRSLSGRGHVPAAVVLTRVSTVAKSSATADIRKYFREKQIDVFTAAIASRSAWLMTGRTGLMVSELTGKDRSEKAVDEMQAVYDEIVQRLQAGEAA